MPFTTVPTPAIAYMENSNISAAALQDPLAAGGTATAQGCPQPKGQPASTLPAQPENCRCTGEALVAFGQFLQAHGHVRKSQDTQDHWALHRQPWVLLMQGQTLTVLLRAGRLCT